MTEDDQPQYTILEVTHRLHHWETTNRPPPIVRRAVYQWIDGLFDDPWQEPAQSVEREHPHHQAIVLHAEIPDTWVEITYTVDETHMDIRVLDIKPIPEEDRTY